MKKIILFLNIFFTGLVSAQEKIGIKETIEKANAGDVNAQLTLGIAYDLGTDGLKENFKEAIFWYTKSAEQGNKDAQLFLATNYYEGKKVERSYSNLFKSCVLVDKSC